MGRLYRIEDPRDDRYLDHFLTVERIMPYHVLKGKDGRSVPILSSGTPEIMARLVGKFDKDGNPVVSFNGKDYTPVPSEGLIYIEHHEYHILDGKDGRIISLEDLKEKDGRNIFLEDFDGRREFLDRKEFNEKYKMAAVYGYFGEKWFYAVDNKDISYLKHAMRMVDYDEYERGLEKVKRGFYHPEYSTMKCINLFDHEFITIPEKVYRTEKVTRIKGIILEGYCSVTLPKSLKKLDGLVMFPGSKVNFPDGFVLKAEDVLGWNDYKNFSREEVDKLIAEHCGEKKVVKADVSKGVDSGVEKVEDKRKKNAVKKYKDFSNKTSTEKDKGLKVK